MIGDVYCENCESSLSSPIGFFTAFTHPGSIRNSKKYFFEHAQDWDVPFEKIRYNKLMISQNQTFPIKIDRKNETILLEYEEEVAWDELTGPKYVWKEKIFKFNESLDNLLRSKFLDSISIIKIKIDELDRKQKRELLGDFIKKILFGISIIEKSSEFKKIKNNSLTPYYKFIQFFYKEYEDYCPLQNSNAKIGAILLASESTNHIYKLQKINISILPVLSKYSFLKVQGSKAVTDSLETQQAWHFFLEGKFEEIKLPICFIENVGFSSFILTELVAILGYNLAELARLKIFKICDIRMRPIYIGAPYTYTARCKFIKNNPDEANHFRMLLDQHKS